METYKANISVSPKSSPVRLSIEKGDGVHLPFLPRMDPLTGEASADRLRFLWRDSQKRILSFCDWGGALDCAQAHHALAT